jgi:hypothetical protein
MNSRLLLALALMLQTQAIRAALLVNGSFEEATNGAALAYDSLSPGSTNIPGWTTPNAELTWDGPALGITPPLTAAQGNDFLDLTGLHDAPPYGAVFQTLTTVVGQQYEVSFEVGSDKYYDGYYTSGVFVAPLVAASFNGSVVFTAVNNFPNYTNYWQTWNFSFSASATSTRLMFTGITSNRVAYIGLDNVIVTEGGLPLVIVLSSPSLTPGQARIPFTLTNTNGAAYTYELLQSAKVNGPWATNHSAVLMTNVPNLSYAFTVPVSGADEFYRVQSP